MLYWPLVLKSLLAWSFKILTVNIHYRADHKIVVEPNVINTNFMIKKETSHGRFVSPVRSLRLSFLPFPIAHIEKKYLAARLAGKALWLSFACFTARI